MSSPSSLRSDLPPPRFFALVPCAGIGSRAIAPGALQVGHSGHSSQSAQMAQAEHDAQHGQRGPSPLPSTREVRPKQYQYVAGQPMVMHTLAAFASVQRIADLLVVVAPGDDFFDHQSSPYAVSACGGATRAESVANGLHDLFEHGARGHDWVLVHDAARCLVTPAQIDALIDACADDPVGGLLALPLPDTLKTEGEGADRGRVAATLPRVGKWLAQTPQMFRIGMLGEALRAAGRAGLAITDEASAMEAMGHAPRLVAGSAQNFKVTYPEDFALAEAVLESRQKTQRSAA